MSKAIFEKIKRFLDENKAEYKILEHEPIGTSKEVAKVRERLLGIPAEQLLKQAVKSMIIRSEGKFYEFNVSAEKQLRRILNTNRLTLATKEEVVRVTDCEPGSVPPFGNLFQIPAYADKTILQNETICFNAGELTHSIFMKKEDWIKLVNPIISEFSM
jgi:Ala-tRNA(Pro) deacylase